MYPVPPTDAEAKPQRRRTSFLRSGLVSSRTRAFLVLGYIKVNDVGFVESTALYLKHRAAARDYGSQVTPLEVSVLRSIYLQSPTLLSKEPDSVRVSVSTSAGGIRLGTNALHTHTRPCFLGYTH